MKKVWIGGAVALVALVALGIGAYQWGWSPRPSSISATVDRSEVISDEAVTVSGVVEPIDPRRLVVVEEKGASGWREVARARTDAVGSFQMPFTPEGRGAWQVRARVVAEGRYRPASSSVVSGSVVDPSSVDASFPNGVRAGKPTRVTGTVSPPAVRQVTVEISRDGQRWKTLASGESDAVGGVSVRVAKPKVGTFHIRLKVEADEEFAEAVSEPGMFFVEDYERAAAKYLDLVAESNSVSARFNALPPDVSLATMKAVAAELAAALSKQSKGFKAYKHWPSEVDLLIQDLLRRNALDIDYYNQLARAASWDEANALVAPGRRGVEEDAPVLIRQALGLPPRP